MTETHGVRWLSTLLVAAALFAVCVAYVPARGELGEDALVGDAISYASMVRGERAVPAPFRYRIIVPLLARALPVSPPQGLAIVSWASLLAAYLVILASARRLGLGRISSAVGLAAAAFTAPHLYHYQNPYLTDATGVLLVAACVHALLRRRFGAFLFACVVGIGVREALIFASPAWLSTGRWARATTPIALSLGAFVAIRGLVGPSTPLEPGPFHDFPARPLHEIIGEAMAAWHGLWLLAPLGLWLVPSRRGDLCFLATLLFAGTVITSLVASDTTRMTEPLFPLVALGTASFLETLWRQSRSVAAALVALSATSSALWQPVRIFGHVSGVASDGVQAVVLSLLGTASFAAVALVIGARARSHGLIGGSPYSGAAECPPVPPLLAASVSASPVPLSFDSAPAPPLLLPPVKMGAP